jgi:hypothetical protein
MKNRLDAALVKLDRVDPAMSQREIDRIISQLARDLTGDELGNLISGELTAEQRARAALHRSQQRLDVLIKARRTQRTKEKSHTQEK